MPNLSPELARADGADARPATFARADEVRVVADALESGEHIGAHERAQKGGGR
jgi:hypothetical protein